ncbi:unnamed protein product, partial [Rangifer tarandus platyrhynchus]
YQRPLLGLGASSSQGPAPRPSTLAAHSAPSPPEPGLGFCPACPPTESSLGSGPDDLM